MLIYFILKKNLLIFENPFLSSECSLVFAGYRPFGYGLSLLLCMGSPQPRGEVWRLRNDRGNNEAFSEGQNNLKS